jgi:hypothetical protein
MKTKEQLAEQYAEEQNSAYTNDYYGFLAGWEACFKYLNTFEKDEEVEVTDLHHIKTNFWFKRKFIKKDSDGKFACRQIDGSVCRWEYIRKLI